MAAPRTPWTTSRLFGSPNPPAPYAMERLYPEIKFDHPVDFALMPGTTRFFVAEQNGRLVSFDTRSNQISPDLVIDLRKHHQPFDSILGFAFHPGFATNRFVFINYNEPGGRTNGSFISRFTVTTTTPPVIEPASERVIIRWLSGGHNGCTLAFGKDGYLYFSTGDAANPDPPDMPFSTGQDISDLLSSVLRIDVDRMDGTNHYSIPRDNPFLQQPGARGEVWAFGFRNPFRMSFDRAGDLWVADVGWEQWEMIYRVKRGGNYGWSITEGPNLSVRSDVKPGPSPILPPLVSLSHHEAASITGGRVYYGNKLPKLRGAYLYGDWETGKFWALRNEADKLISNDELCDTTLKPVAFAEDSSAEMLILDYNGGIYGLISNSAPPANLAFPKKLSETGLFSDLAALSPSAGVMGYRPTVPMWNDFATARHWIAAPGNAPVVTGDGRETIAGRMWDFPSNTVLARTLSLEMERGKSSSKKYIETQILHFDGQGWNPYTFRWNNAQSDAELVPAEGANDIFAVSDASAPGGRREIPWRYSGRVECMRCHNAWAGETLSFNWFQLNAARSPSKNSTKDASKTSPDSQSPKAEWERLVDAGLLKLKNKRQDNLALADPHDASLSIADRARSWLHVNCSPCHRNGAGGGVPAQFNFDQGLEKSRAYNEKPTRGDFGIRGARIIAPGDPSRSTLFYRISTEGSGHMPIIGTRLVDENAVRLLADFFRSLPAVAMPGEELSAVKKISDANAAAIHELKSTPNDTGQLITNLLTSMNGALHLIDELSEGKGTNGTPLNQPPKIGFARTHLLEIARIASTHTNTLIRDLFQRYLPPDQRRPTLGPEIRPEMILSRTGDRVRGHELFNGASQCFRCHLAGGAGRALGPDLTGIGKKYNRAQLLEQILQPSKIIAPEYKNWNVTLKDDSEINGLITKRDAVEVLMRDETLLERRIKVSEIKEMRESVLSAMPEGLLAPLTAQEAADLLEYLVTN